MPPPVSLAGLAVGLLLLSCQTGLAEPACDAPEPVCAAREGVFAISSAFDPYASAVRIGPNLLVTNRHGVAGEEKVEITLPGGGKTQGEVVPTSWPGDLVLLRAPLPEGPSLSPAAATDGALYAIGRDISQRAIRVFPKGQLLLSPAEGKPLARLHHTAYTQPGVSGGALVNEAGALVGIATSGGSGRFEAIPASRIAALEAESGAAHAKRSKEIGEAYETCILEMEEAQRAPGAMSDEVAGRIRNDCAATGNRQLFDLAGQALGRARKFDDAIDFFQRSLDMDPNAINARIGLVITLMFARRNEDALDHVRWLVDVVPESTEVQRFAVHVGKGAGDMALAEKGLELIKRHNPAQYEAAKRFMDMPAPAQRGR